MMDWSGIISSVAAAVAAIAAMLTVYMSKVSMTEERKSKRPYIANVGFLAEQILERKCVRICLEVKNIGVHPVYGFNGKAIVLDTDLTKDLDLMRTYSFSVADEIPFGSAFPLIIEDKNVSCWTQPQYIVVFIVYSDLIFSESFNQIFYLKWPGSGDKNDFKSIKFDYLRIEEKDKLEKEKGLRKLFKDLQYYEHFKHKGLI